MNAGITKFSRESLKAGTKQEHRLIDIIPRVSSAATAKLEGTSFERVRPPLLGQLYMCNWGSRKCARCCGFKDEAAICRYTRPVAVSLPDSSDIILSPSLQVGWVTRAILSVRFRGYRSLGKLASALVAMAM